MASETIPTPIETRFIPGITARLLFWIISTSMGLLFSVFGTYFSIMGSIEKNRSEVLDLVKDVRRDQMTYMKTTDLRLQFLETNLKILEQRVADIEKNKSNR
jgi:hypothetical protein